MAKTRKKSKTAKKFTPKKHPRSKRTGRFLKK